MNLTGPVTVTYYMLTVCLPKTLFLATGAQWHPDTSNVAWTHFIPFRFFLVFSFFFLFISVVEQCWKQIPFFCLLFPCPLINEVSFLQTLQYKQKLSAGVLARISLSSYTTKVSAGLLYCFLSGITSNIPHTTDTMRHKLHSENARCDF